MKERIKKIRKELDLTQHKFSDKIGVKRNMTAMYEMGKQALFAELSSTAKKSCYMAAKPAE